MLGKQHERDNCRDDLVITEASKVVPGFRSTDIIRFGVAGQHRSLFPEAWTGEKLIFEAFGGKAPSRTQAGTWVGHPERVSPRILNRKPVDVLVIEESRGDGTIESHDDRYWERWINECTKANLPELVIVCAMASEIVKEGGLHSKQWRRRALDWGYDPGYWFLRGHEHGGVVRQDRTILVLRKQAGLRPPILSQPLPTDADGHLRSATNMLKPAGIPRKAFHNGDWTERSYDKCMTEAIHPCRVLGETSDGQRPVFCPSASLPDSIGTLIKVDRPGRSSQVRQLLAEELGKAKGFPPEWELSSAAIAQGTDIHTWAAIADTIWDAWHAAEIPMADNSEPPKISGPSWTNDPEDVERDSTANETWCWNPPDLSEGSEWYNERVRNLHLATDGRPDKDELFQSGLLELAIHRTNYGAEGIKHLQILWWEWPPEHWDELREGCPMNFLTEPDGEVVGNQEMDDEALEVAANFVDELWAIGVFEAIPPGSAMKANAPLFCVPKAGQPGQWRCIADMKRGGQNTHIGKDPVHLPRVGDILPRMYTNGWTAIVDASKFFHNFPTHPG